MRKRTSGDDRKAVPVYTADKRTEERFMTTKRIIAMMLTLAMVLSLAACSGGSGSEEQSKDEAVTEKQTETTTRDGDKVLVLYFSADNTKDVDAVSSATPMVGDTSATKWIAEIIHDEMGGDIEAIIPSVDYPLEYDECADYAKKETDSDARPAYEKLSVDPASYDIIFIGYPMWWYTIPMVLETFFDDYDLSGKTIVPFNTHAGSRDGGTYKVIQEREPGATVLEGIAISGSSAGSDDAKTEILDWLDGLGLK
jgi:flavodoxin